MQKIVLDKPRYNGQVGSYPISDIQSGDVIRRGRETTTDTGKRVSIRTVQFGNGVAMRTLKLSIGKNNGSPPMTKVVGFLPVGS